MAYATLSELKQFVGIPTADTVDDVTLQLALDSASLQVDAFCDQTFGDDATPTVRLYEVADTHQVDVDPIASATGLVVKTDDNNDGVFETTWTIDVDFRLEPLNAAVSGQPFDRLVALGTRWFPKLAHRPGLQVTATHGWPTGTAPAPVKNATLIQASRLWKRKDAPFGVAGSVEFGSEMRLLAKLDPDVESLLRPYRRMWWVA